MRTLTVLIRYKKQLLDEQRRKLTALENQRQQWLQRSEGMRKELEREMELAANQPEMGGFFGNFAGRIRQRQEQIAKEIAKVDKEIAKQSEKIREGFIELKRFEILRERRIAEKKALLSKQEVEQLDEVAQHHTSS